MRVTTRMLGVGIAVACATACGIGGFVAAEAAARALPATATTHTRPQARAHARAPIAITRDGRVRGRVVDNTDEFLGIPYAKPPVGALRWRAPQAPARWHGTRPAVKLPPRCPQLESGNGPMSTDQNCLYLSIYRPHGVSAHARLPVLFWIHGGGLTSGSGDQHNGSLLADTNHIEVVSINYRLGIFGFLALPSLSREAGDGASGDYGLLDQEAALRWTHDNIARFGGNPRRLAIAGESAGGYSVCALLASPTVRGLYSRAIIQSGSCESVSQKTALRDGTAFARSVGCRVVSRAAACLRRRSTRSLLHAKRYPGSLLPVTGGRELPVAPETVIRRGRFPHVPVLIGTNHDEGRTFAQGFAKDPESTYVKTIDTEYGKQAAAVLAQYPYSSFPQPYATAYALAAVWTDSGYVGGIGGCATQNLVGLLSRYTTTYMYQFDDLNAPGLNHDVPGYMWGAGHAMELAFMWPSFNNGYSLYDEFTPAERELSEQMVRWWGTFTATGAPDVPGQAGWPQYSSGALLSLQPGDLSAAISADNFAGEHDCAFWNSLPGEPRS